ncbi:allantoate amidohydrolase [Nocardioides perillae]|uniref:N-carbamoyl-L-amino-acid hydrolase n=1 Tax=Nocardioides perillae TaxID=1119534 RepID=A0A7Y9RSF1_9ACTN|nr:N-carbamoyl-L-amino-acid hydrolase [Nocardioides perillae]
MVFEQMWRDLAPVGRSAATGGYHRQPWTAVDAELRAWFREEAERRGLAVEQDPLGNLVAWWRPAGTEGARPVLTGSHLDSVADGGAYDGPLGVVSALAAVDLLRERGTVPTRPVGVAVFVEEEGSRFGLACLGSRLATGQATWADVRHRRDAAGTALEDALAAADLGDDPAATGPDGLRWGWLADVEAFVELHVEQGRGLVDLGAPVGVAAGIWPHGRWRLDVTGRADHAGTTRMEDRADPVLTFAMTALAASKQARLAGQRATVGRVEVHPGAANAVPSRVSAWLDARADTEEALAQLVAGIERQARDRAARDGTALEVTAESVSPRIAFDADLAQRLAAGHERGGWPVLWTQAGHDAGVLAAAGVPSAMLFVRNPTGVSHSPEEHAEVPDCLAGVEALADALARLAA